jgi:flagellar export protein FliJ
MAIFEFRLEKVLQFRQMQESWAKDAYLDARAARLEAEVEILNLKDRRGQLLEKTATDIDSRRALELTLLRIDDQERSQNHVLAVLANEEETAMNAWQHQKRELETLVQLREAALEEFKAEEARREQADLDEWAVMRRAA